MLEGQKRWIGNSTFADLLVILARNTTTNQVNGYVRFLVSLLSQILYLRCGGRLQKLKSIRWLYIKLLYGWMS